MANRADNLLRRASETPDRIALIFDDAPISFGELAARTTRTATALHALGVRAGDHVGIWLPSTPDFIIVQQALFMLGAVVTPLNIMYRPGEIQHAIQCCALDRIVTAGELASGIDGILTCAIATVEALRDAAGAPDVAAATIDDEAPAMLLMTSATTGKAKGVMLSAANLAANYDRTPGWLGLDGDSVILCPLPLYNTFGLNQGINAMLVTGGTMVLLPRFDAEQCIRAIDRHGCTFFPAVPTMLQKIVDHPLADRESLRSLRTIMTGGAPVPSALLRRLLELAPDVRLLTGYGLTEATALVTLTAVRLGADGQVERERTIGRVLEGMEIAIVDEGRNPLPAMASGEIMVRGPNVMAGYFNAPADSMAALSGGWLHSGDIGYLDAEGYAYIVDRKKDLIIRGGQNIYPAEIEEALYQIDGVAEAAVIARPDPVLGEVPIAFVALRDGRVLTGDQMMEHCRASLATYKCPVAIEVRQELPKGPTGKILRRALRLALQAA